MPKFHVNKRMTSNKLTIEADSYYLKDDYWTFDDVKGNAVFTVTAKLVNTIEREDSAQQS